MYIHSHTHTHIKTICIYAYAYCVCPLSPLDVLYIYMAGRKKKVQRTGDSTNDKDMRRDKGTHTHTPYYVMRIVVNM